MGLVLQIPIDHSHAGKVQKASTFPDLRPVGQESSAPPIPVSDAHAPAGNLERSRSCHVPDPPLRDISNREPQCSRTNCAPYPFLSQSESAPALEYTASVAATAPGRNVPACEAHCQRTRTLASGPPSRAAHHCGSYRWRLARDSPGNVTATQDLRAHLQSRVLEAAAPEHPCSVPFPSKSCSAQGVNWWHPMQLYFLTTHQPS